MVEMSLAVHDRQQVRGLLAEVGYEEGSVLEDELWRRFQPHPALAGQFEERPEFINKSADVTLVAKPDTVSAKVLERISQPSGTQASKRVRRPVSPWQNYVVGCRCEVDVCDGKNHLLCRLKLVISDESDISGSVLWIHDATTLKGFYRLSGQHCTLNPRKTSDPARVRNVATAIVAHLSKQ